MKVNITLCSYNNIDKKIQQSYVDNNTILIILDVFPKDTSVLIPFIKRKNLLVIDHHETSAEHCNYNHMIYSIPSHGNEGMSAALLTYKFFEHDSTKNLEHIAQLTSVYDLWQLDSPLRKKSEDLNILFQMYWEKMADAFIDGRTEFNEKELAYIKSEKDRFEKTWQSIDFYDIDDYPKIPGKFFITTDFINDVCTRIFDENPNVLICFGFSSKSNTLSVRSRESLDVNIGEILSSLGIGGGHKNSCGIRTSEFSIEWLVSTIKLVMSEINKNI